MDRSEESKMLFTCGCLNVELRCEAAATKSFENDLLRTSLGGRLVLLERPQRHVRHEWLLRENSGVRHCCACNTNVYSVQPVASHQAAGFQPQAIVVSESLKRDDAWVESLRSHPSFSECFRILVDPAVAHELALLQESAGHGSFKEDSLVPGSMEEVRLKAVQVVKQMIAEKQWQIEEEYRRALDALKQQQSKWDLQCNTLLKIIEYQETAEERRSSTNTTQSCSSPAVRSESMDSKTSQRSGGLRETGSSAGLEDDVFDMQFNDEAMYEDRVTGIERAEEARESAPDVDEQSDDEVLSTLSQERTRRSSMDLTQYAASAPIQVPVDVGNWASLRPREHGLEAREPSPARPECMEDIARSMRDISDRMLDDHTKVFGDLPRPRLYTNQF